MTLSVKTIDLRHYTHTLYIIRVLVKNIHSKMTQLKRRILSSHIHWFAAQVKILSS